MERLNAALKSFTIGFMSLVVLSGCDSSAPSPSLTLDSTPSADTSSASPVTTVAPSVAAPAGVTPTVVATPSPSPSPSVSPTPYAFSGGSGTLADPYQLDTATDVQNISQSPTAYFSVMQDISMNGINFVPIPSFSGTIYGNNRHLYNLTMTTTGTTKAAMFTSLSGTVVNLTLSNVSISSQSYSAAFAANVTASGMISSCGVSGTITSPSGGNGFNTGIGNSVYTTNSGGSVINTTQSVAFNGNNVTYKFP